MRRYLKPLALVFILVGLLAGPGYWAYAKFFTGSDAALIDLRQEPGAPGLARTWKSAPFRLDAEMAPAGLVLHAQGRYAANLSPAREPKDRYSAVLARDGSDAKPLAFSMGVKRVTEAAPTLREHLLLMNKVQSGEYTLSVSQAAEPAIEIDALRLQVRQHLLEPNPDAIMAGFTLLVVGLLTLTLL